MEQVAKIEEYSEDEDNDGDVHAGPSPTPIVCSSFSPENYPPNVSHVPLSEEEVTKARNASDPISRDRSTQQSRRYLPCHYFDYIGGSSTGASVLQILSAFGRRRLKQIAGLLQLCSVGSV